MTTFTPENEMHGIPCDPTEQLAAAFIEDESSASLHVAVRGTDNDGSPWERPAGAWLRIIDYGSDGRSLVCVEMSGFEVRCLIYAFLVRCEAEITSRLIFDVEQVAKYAMVARDAGTVQATVRVIEWEPEVKG